MARKRKPKGKAPVPKQVSLPIILFKGISICMFITLAVSIVVNGLIKG